MLTNIVNVLPLFHSICIYIVVFSLVYCQLYLKKNIYILTVPVVHFIAPYVGLWQFVGEI